MKNSTIAIIIVITLIIVMLASGIIYAFSTSAPQGAEEPKADAAAESNTETESVTDTAAPEEPPETERKIEIINNLSADIPGLTGNRELLGVVKAGAVAEMVQSVKASGMKVEDIQNIYQRNDTDLYFGVYGYGELYGNLRISSLYRINDVLPIEFMKQIDEDHLYVVYKVYGRDDMILYTYVFFDKVPEECNETCESWRRRGNIFYLVRPLEYSDFADIHIGSTNAEVHAVDPVVYPGLYPDDYPKEPFKSYHLMKDGVLTITYSFEPEADRPLVSAMDYDDSFTFASYKNSDYRMNVRIDPNDLPAPSSSDVEVK